jgi:cell division protein ZapB
LEIKDLEAKIDELIVLLDELERKQAMMAVDKNNWQLERSRLLEKNELAKNKVEAMIMRLKALDQD